MQERLRNHYIPEITSIQYEGQYVDAPQPVEWYPDKLAWYMTTPKNVIRRFGPFANFQKFLVAETDVGNITRQEVVSMIPPLVMDLKPGMTVLDLCAAPGSKSAQLLELINSGEEDRARQVSDNLAKGVPRPEGIEYADDGRSTGLLVANDVDYKRAHMLVHQMKRLSSPNIIVTNHDATVYPSIKLSSRENSEGKVVSNRYLKFDRILADVPCSGDGTTRKNLDVWRMWTPGNALGLHATQTRILIRALQMLKVGGRVVYSTCSMNPVEDEAVLASAIAQCGGTDVVELLETKDLLPGLQRSPGLRKWKIMDKSARIWSSWKEVEEHQAQYGMDGFNRLSETMFPTNDEVPLERAMRVYAHKQNTGAFFISILEKKSEIRTTLNTKPAGAAKTESSSKVQSPLPADGDPLKADVEITDANGSAGIPEVTMQDLIPSAPPAEGALDANGAGDSAETANKRKREDESPSQPEHKRVKSQDGQLRKKGAQFEEPFKYISPDISELQTIKSFYELSPRFPMDRFMVRNAEGNPTKKIYYTTALAKEILQENEGKGMKFVHSGVNMFVKQDAPSPDTCPWRIQTDGLRILETWVGPQRIVKLQKKETLRKLLVEMFPRFHDDDWQSLDELGDQMRNMSMGCCVLVVEPSEGVGGFSERMVFPLWKSIHSLNLMMPKEDRKAMLLRLFNDDTPLQNMNLNKTPKGTNGDKAKSTTRQEERASNSEDIKIRVDESRNTSSPEPEAKIEKDVLSEDDDDDGGVAV